MIKFYKNKYPEINIYKKKSIKSELVTQMIYGESFLILKRFNKWFKIKIKDDGYIGFVKKKEFLPHTLSTHKVSVLSAKVYNAPNKKKIINKLTFFSKIRIKESYKKFKRFESGWVENKDIKPINYKNRNIFSNIKIFKNVKYKWGGKTFKGLDCSALVQLFLNFNNKFCPRDAKDQEKYFKKNINFKNIKKNNIIYWKGHVAIVISNKKLIHAYGPLKKTVIMSTEQAIKKIEKTANLKVISIKKI